MYITFTLLISILKFYFNFLKTTKLSSLNTLRLNEFSQLVAFIIMLMLSVVTLSNKICQLIGFLEMLIGVFWLTTSIHFPLGPGSYLEYSASLSRLFIGFL